MMRALGVAFFLLLLNLGLNWRVFLPGESPYRQSIELNYAGMAKWVKEYPNFWGWKPTQYGGLPTAYQYVPAVPYTVAAISAPTGTSHERVHRLLTAAATAALPCTAFLLAWYFTRSILWSALAGLAITFFSPAYGLVPTYDRDRSPAFIPWRWHLLAKYGEGPHNAGLALIPLAVLAVTHYAQRGLKHRLAIAAVALALVPLVNWVAALSLAIVMICWLAASFGFADKAIWRRRAVAAAVLGYLLACFALTPTFIKTIAFNWPVDSPNFHAVTQQRLAVVWLVLSFVALRAVLYWMRVDLYRTFVTLAAYAFGYIVVRFGFAGLDVIPEAHRYGMEFELFLLLALAAWAHAAWRGTRVQRACAVVFTVFLLFEGSSQVLHYGWAWYHPVDTASTEEYKVAQWLREHMTNGRALLSGGLRFRIASWFDVPQVGGGFESGLKNRVPVDWSSAIRHNVDDVDLSIQRMQTLDVRYVVVHGPQSTEFYKDYANPAKFEGRLEKVAVIGGTTVFRVPASEAWEFCWIGPSYAELRNFDPSQPLLVPVSHDPGWMVRQDGRELRIERDSSGFMTVWPRSASKIEMKFGPTAEQIVFAAISAAAWLYTATLLLLRIRTLTRSKVPIVNTRPT